MDAKMQMIYDEDKIYKEQLVKDIKIFLESQGYYQVCYEGELEKDHHKIRFQKHVEDLYPNTPLCPVNKAVLINIYFWNPKVGGKKDVNFTMYICHGDDEWCDLQIYKITQEKLISDIKNYEDTLVKLWEVYFENIMKG